MNRTDYKLLNAQLESLSSGICWDITVLSNASAILWEALQDINWSGFYIARNGRLELGPFQGKTACTVIEYGKGVCGTAAAEGRTQLVPDVHLFPGHIACDAASRSEIVVPLYCGGELYGVLDIDSPDKGRFTEEDREGLELFASLLGRILEQII